MQHFSRLQQFRIGKTPMGSSHGLIRLLSYTRYELIFPFRPPRRRAGGDTLRQFWDTF